MAFNYRTKLSRSRNLVNLALGNENNSAQNNDLGYENDDFIENSDDNLCKYFKYVFTDKSIFKL